MANATSIQPLIVVFNGDESQLRSEREVIKKSLVGTRFSNRLASCIAPIKVAGFRSRAVAAEYIGANPMAEVVLIVSDSIGFKPPKAGLVAELRKRFSRSATIAYSEGLSTDEIYILQNKYQLIDRHVHRREGLDELVAACKECLDRYYYDPMLETVRHYLGRCDDPESPILSNGDREFSAKELYLEMVKGTNIGNAFLQEWRGLLKQAIEPSIATSAKGAVSKKKAK